MRSRSPCCGRRRLRAAMLAGTGAGLGQHLSTLFAPLRINIYHRRAQSAKCRLDFFSFALCIRCAKFLCVLDHMLHDCPFRLRGRRFALDHSSLLLPCARNPWNTKALRARRRDRCRRAPSGGRPRPRCRPNAESSGGAPCHRRSLGRGRVVSST